MTTKTNMAISLIIKEKISAYAAAKRIGVSASAIYNSLNYQKHIGVIKKIEVDSENIYEVKNRFEKNFVKTTGCWEWAGKLSTYGYGVISLRGRPVVASRVSYQIYVGKIVDKLHVLHKCDNRKCVNPDHLFLGSNKENMTDRNLKNRTAKGEKNGSSKLIESQVIEIRNDTRTDRALAKIYGVNRATINNIKNNKLWRHVK